MVEVTMAERHSHLTPEGRAYWLTEQLWEAAKDLPVRRIAIADIPEFEQDCWFGGRNLPSCRAVAEHARRIMAADLAHPIILSSDGQLMDGGHRIAKAWLAGATEIDAVRFESDPPPDHVSPLEAG
jgi:hypothetical protein